MHGLHDLTGNDDKSLKGESFVCFNCRKINIMKQLTLYFVFCRAALPLSYSSRTLQADPSELARFFATRYVRFCLYSGPLILSIDI